MVAGSAQFKCSSPERESTDCGMNNAFEGCVQKAYVNDYV